MPPPGETCPWSLRTPRRLHLCPLVRPSCPRNILFEKISICAQKLKPLPNAKRRKRIIGGCSRVLARLPMPSRLGRQARRGGGGGTHLLFFTLLSIEAPPTFRRSVRFFFFAPMLHRETCLFFQARETVSPFCVRTRHTARIAHYS